MTRSLLRERERERENSEYVVAHDDIIRLAIRVAAAVVVSVLIVSKSVLT